MPESVLYHTTDLLRRLPALLAATIHTSLTVDHVEVQVSFAYVVATEVGVSVVLTAIKDNCTLFLLTEKPKHLGLKIHFIILFLFFMKIYAMESIKSCSILS